MDTSTPKLYFVHVDHLQRPIMMSDATKASVWNATWLPFGGAHSLTGTAANDNRFPGQWFQIETNLHYNWNRHYDPTTGRYTQADPLGLVDGPSVYAYAGSNPQNFVDPTGQFIPGADQLFNNLFGKKSPKPKACKRLGDGPSIDDLNQLFNKKPRKFKAGDEIIDLDRDPLEGTTETTEVDENNRKREPKPPGPDGEHPLTPTQKAGDFLQKLLEVLVNSGVIGS